MRLVVLGRLEAAVDCNLVEHAKVKSTETK